MFKKLAFSAILLFGAVLALTGNARAQTTVAYIDAIRQEMQDGSMDKWRGQMPMLTFIDCDAYINQFGKWAHLIDTGNQLELNTEQAQILTSYKNSVKDIQATAFPQMRASYQQMFQAFFEHYGLTPEYLEIEIAGAGNSTMKITSEAFADQEFLPEFYEGIWPSWPYCRFQQVELYVALPQETLLIRKFKNNAEISDQSLLVYQTRKEYKLIE